MATSTIKKDNEWVKKAGDTMTGVLTFETGNGNNGLSWFSNNGTQFMLKRNDPYDTITLLVNGPNTSSTWIAALVILDDGSVFLSKPLGVPYGGTGATQGTIDITDYCVFPTGNVNTSSPYGGRLYYNPYLNCVFGTIVMNDNASVNNQADIVYLKKDSSGTPLWTNRSEACGVCVHSEVMPVVAPRISGSTIISSHSTGSSIYTPRYTIMAFLG